MDSLKIKNQLKSEIIRYWMILNVSSISILFFVQLKFQDKNPKFKVPTLSRVFLKIHFEELFSYT